MVRHSKFILSFLKCTLHCYWLLSPYCEIDVKTYFSNLWMLLPKILIVTFLVFLLPNTSSHHHSTFFLQLSFLYILDINSFLMHSFVIISHVPWFISVFFIVYFAYENILVWCYLLLPTFWMCILLKLYANNCCSDLWHGDLLWFIWYLYECYWFIHNQHAF